MTPIDPISLAASIAAILDDLGIRYVIGGSVASSVLGEPRSTLDLDLMVEIDEPKARLLCNRLHDDFYVDEEHAADAVARGSSFNAIHYGSSIKVDFFTAEPFAITHLDRRLALRLRSDLPPLYFYSPEDLILRKLLWFRAGGESSARQWRDVVGIMKASSADLDREYLLDSASRLDVAGLVDRAAGEAGLDLRSP